MIASVTVFEPLPTCPKCGAQASACKRPSGHMSKRWHAERVALFEAWMRDVGAPEGEYDAVGRTAVLKVRYPSADEWNAMSPDEQDSWWDNVRGPHEFFDPPPAHPPGDYQLTLGV